MNKGYGVTAGARLKALRINAEMKVSTLARILDINPYTLKLLERGAIDNPHVAQIVLAAQYFGVTTDYLLGHGQAGVEKNGRIGAVSHAMMAGGAL